MVHIPVLRRGVAYRSMDTTRTNDFRTGEPFVEISQANPGLIRRDLLRQAESRDALAQFTTAGLIRMCGEAAEYFHSDTLPLGDEMQSPDDYIHQVSTTTGLPYNKKSSERCKENIRKTKVK